MITITITEEEVEVIQNAMWKEEEEIDWIIQSERFTNKATIEAQKKKKKINSIRNKIWQAQ